MTALSEPKNVACKASAFSQRTEDFGGGVLTDSVTFYPGALVALDVASGTIEPATAKENLICLGRYEGDEVVTSADVETIMVMSGVYKLNNSDTSAITSGGVGSVCYVEDDQTVTSAAAGTSKAGIVVSVEADGVFVAINPYTIA